jgi:hypothetical protein
MPPIYLSLDVELTGILHCNSDAINAEDKWLHEPLDWPPNRSFVTSEAASGEEIDSARRAGTSITLALASASIRNRTQSSPSAIAFAPMNRPLNQILQPTNDRAVGDESLAPLS